MSTPLLDATQHRKLGVDLFNATWKLLDMPERTREEDDRMIHSAHASRLHWEFAGDASNLAIGEWQISRVYAVLGRQEPALYHARRSLEICEENGLRDFMLAWAHEAMARALSLSGDPEAGRHIALAREVGQEMEEEEDRQRL